MEFKLVDSHEDIGAGWRLARTADVESQSELARAELCGMTFNTCSLEDGTVGGPRLGYQITKIVDDTLDHKLLITDPLSEGILADMKTDLKSEIVADDMKNGHTNGHFKDTDHLNGTNTTEAPFRTGNDTPSENDTPSDEQKTLTQPIITDYGVETLQNSPDQETETTHSLTVGANINVGEAADETPSIIDTPEHTSCDVNVSGDSESLAIASNAETLTNSIPSDMDSVKSESPNVKKKKAKPMSASMQRLTAKKESPDKRGTELLSASERKAKADELRKKKIEDQRVKDEERRAAVLERRKKLEAVEREKKEALFKRLTTKDSDKAARPSPMKGRYSLSTSNLSQLKKNKPVDLNTSTRQAPKSTDPLRPRSSMADRPKSSMQRPSMGYPDDRKRDEVKRPHTAFGSRTSVGAPKPSRPSPRQPVSTTTQPPRPQTSLGHSTGAEKKKQSLSSRQLDASAERLSTTRKPLSKSKSTSNVNMSSTRPASAASSRNTGTKPKTSRSNTPAGDKDSKTESHRKEKPPAKPKDLPPAKKELTKEEAKKALAERRKKAKEEAEEKAREEREKDEAERLKREEDERRLAEQLKLEEERQAALLDQLKKEEEERKTKLIEEKEQRDREEKERMEEEQRLREEEIEKKAKLEMEKIQKEQDRQEELLEQERIERKKRVEMIMARVSSKRTTAEDPEASTASSTPTDTPPVTATPPPELVTNAESARLKVDDILRSRGFGKSTEDISKVLEKREEIVGLSTNITTTTVATSGESLTTTTEESTGTTASPNESTHVEDSTDVEMKSSHTTETLPPSETFSSDFDASNENTKLSNDENHSTSIPIPDLAPITNGDSTAHISNGTSSLALQESPSSVEPATTPLTDGSHAVPYELSDAVEELKLSDEGGDISLNDTNNNKDFVVDNALSSPVVLNAWSDNGSNAAPSTDSTGKHLNHVETDAMNGTDERESVVNGTNDFHAKEDDFDTTASTLESNEWKNFDERMMQIQSPSVEPVPAGEEKLWKVLEGKVEMSECY